MYWIKVYDLPQGSRNSRGKPMVAVLPLADGEKSTPCCRSRRLPTPRRTSRTTSRTKKSAVKAKGLFIFMHRQRHGETPL